MFLAPNFFGGVPPEFLDLHYKIHLRSRGKVSRRSAERARRSHGESKKTSRVKHKAFGTNVPSGLIKEPMCRPFPCSFTQQKMPKTHCVACVRLAVVLMSCYCAVVSRSATVRSESDIKFKLKVNCNNTELRSPWNIVELYNVYPFPARL